MTVLAERAAPEINRTLDLPIPIIEAADRFPVGVDHYRVLVSTPHSTVSDNVEAERVRVMVNGVWQILCEKLEFNSEPLPLSTVIYRPGWSSNTKERAREFVSGVWHGGMALTTFTNGYHPLFMTMQIFSATGKDMLEYESVAHELTHALHNHRIGIFKFPPRIFLQDGFAEMGAKIVTTSDDGRNKPTSGFDLIPKEYDIFEKNCLTEGYDLGKLSYHRANGWFFRYLFETYGMDKLIELSNVTKGLWLGRKKTLRALNEVYGRDMATLLAEAKLWLFEGQQQTE